MSMQTPLINVLAGKFACTIFVSSEVELTKLK